MNHPRSPSRFARWLAASAGAIALFAGGARAAEPRVGVSVSVAQAGFYGRVDIGDQPPPAVIYTQPVVIHQTPVAVHRRPIYLRVPPGHYRHWAKHCGRYAACGQPVYFVRYDERRAPRWRDNDPDRFDLRHHRESYRDRHHDHNRDRHHHHDRGHRHGHGHGHDRH